MSGVWVFKNGVAKLMANPEEDSHKRKVLVSVPTNEMACGPQRQTVKVCCKTNSNYALGVRGGKAKLVCSDANDQTQKWEMIKSPCGKNFVLVNKGTGQALAHPNCEKKEVFLTCYDPHSNCVNNDILWNQGADLGCGYHAVRSACNTALNMDLLDHAVGDCSRIGMWDWNGGNNQLWNFSSCSC